MINGFIDFFVALELELEHVVMGLGALEVLFNVNQDPQLLESCLQIMHKCIAHGYCLLRQLRQAHHTLDVLQLQGQQSINHLVLSGRVSLDSREVGGLCHRLPML